MMAVDAVLKGELDNAFCAVRPPGHHAERDRAMGFCFFNNIALGAVYALEHYGLERVAIFDWDVQMRIFCGYGNRQSLQPIFSANAGRPVFQDGVHKVLDFGNVCVRKGG